MRTITQEEFNKIYEEHQKWIRSDKTEGKRANFEKTFFSNIIFPLKANLRGANLQEANLEEADLRDADLRETNFQWAVLPRANLQGVDLRRANLEEADLRDADLRETSFQWAVLPRANLEEADLRDADLRETSFQWAVLPRANLQDANLQGADLWEANLLGANLQRADLREADLRGANLQRANLWEADLREANLEGADLRGANLQSANLQGAKLEGAILEKQDKNGQEQKVIKEYQDKIEQLEQERISLITSTENKDLELEENQKQLDNLKIELQKQEEQLKEATENRIGDITKAFKTFDDSGTDLKKERKLLTRMFNSYFGGIVLAVILLFIVWYRFYNKVDSFVPTESIPKMEIIDIWINLSPSLFLAGSIVFFIYQMHKCQRQMVILNKLLYKPKQIEGILKAYYYVSGDNKSVNDKINKVLDNYVEHIINQDIDTEREESSMKESDKKEAGTNEKLLDMLTEVIKKIKL
ncbi:pentapeptide repeat-containing protein [Dysgonomonas reticulitermitis]